MGDGSKIYGDGKTTTANGPAAKGWELVGNSADLQSRASMTANLNTSSTQVSSYWLVMAHNTACSWKGCDAPAGACTNGTTTTWDYFKVNTVEGVQPPSTKGAPEPGSLALFGTMLAGLTWAGRRGAVK